MLKQQLLLLRKFVARSKCADELFVTIERSDQFIKKSAQEPVRNSVHFTFNPFCRTRGPFWRRFWRHLTLGTFYDFWVHRRCYNPGQQPRSTLLRGMDTIHHFSWSLHSFTAALGTQLSCGRYLKKSQNKIQFQNLYFPRRPHDLSLYGSTAPTRCSVVLKNCSLLSYFEQVASSVQTLRRAVRLLRAFITHHDLRQQFCIA